MKMRNSEMPTEMSPANLTDIPNDLKPFIADIDDDRGWCHDVLSRMYREGKIEAGDVSCDYSLQKAINHKLVANIQDNGKNDYSYQLTELGKLYCITFIESRLLNIKFKAGDLVILDHIEYDNYYDLYKVVAIKGKALAVSLVEDWKRVDSIEDLNQIKVKGLIVETDEAYHVTWEEEQSNERS